MERLRRRLASYRFRRRLLAVTLLAVAALACATVAVLYPNTAAPEPPPTGGVAQLYVAPTPAFLTAAETRSALEVAQRFLRTAVRRERMGEAYTLAGPSIRQGMTIEEWTTQDVAVVPYPVDFARWRIDYSFDDELGLQVYVFPDASRNLRPMTFLMSLKPVGPGPKQHWVVDAWVPRGAAPSTIRPNREGNAFDLGAAVRALPPAKPRLGPEWLLVPFVLLVGGLVLIPTVLVIQERRRTARARAEAAAWEERRRTGLTG